MTKSKVVVMRSAKSVTVVVNGKSFYIDNDTLEESMELYKKVMGLKEDGNIQEIQRILDPGHRIEVDLKGVLNKDRLGNYFMGDYTRALPHKLLETIKEHLDHDLPMGGIVNFWKLLMLNPDEHVKESLFKFADRFRMPITDNGYFIAYKSVAWKGEAEKSLGVLVSKEYVAKKAAGRNTHDLIVVDYGDNNHQVLSSKDYALKVEDMRSCNLDIVAVNHAEEFLLKNKHNEFKMAQGNLGNIEEIKEFARNYGWVEPTTQQLGNIQEEKAGWEMLGYLDEMFKNISDMFDFDTPTFTDWHTKRSTIKLGEPVSMPREECDNNPRNTCSSGLHVGAPGYVSKFGNSGDSNYILACLVNPMNVAAIPDDYNFEKLRTCEYLPYAVCEMTDGAIKELDTNYFEDDYINYEREMLEATLGELDMNDDTDLERDKIIRDRLVDLGTPVIDDPTEDPLPTF